jgi:hypothetical protein
MQMLPVSGSMDWGTWLRGIIGAFVSRGANSLTTGASASLLDKGHDLNILHLMGATFILSGIISMGKFLVIQSQSTSQEGK